MVADDHDINFDVERDEANDAADEVEQNLDTLQDGVNEMMNNGIIWDLDIRTSWAVFPALAMYDEEKDGETDMMLGQDPWLD